MKETLKLALEALEFDGFTPEDQTHRAYTTKAITAIKEALAQSEQCQCPNCKVTLHASDCAVHSEPAYPKGECNCGAQPEQEFFTHCVDQPYDWSEWVCPDPKSYLFKCCDCGLVHEAEFGVVRYKSDTDREDCDMVDDPNLQAVFRMRRSEQWSPKDTAHRAGGLPMEQPAQQYNATSDHQLMENAQGDLERIKLVQTGVGIGKPEQEPVAWLITDEKINSLQVDSIQRLIDRARHAHMTDIKLRINGQDEWFQADWLKHLTRTTPPQRKPLTDEQMWEVWNEQGDDAMEQKAAIAFARAIEAAHGIKEVKSCGF